MSLTHPTPATGMRLGDKRAPTSPLFRATAAGTIICVPASRVLTLEGAIKALPSYRDCHDALGVNQHLADDLQAAIADAHLVRARAQ